MSSLISSSKPLDPWWVTGFVDGEGCFSISFSQRKKLSYGIEVRPSFSVSQSSKRFPPREVMDDLRAFFRCGEIRYSRQDGTYKYEVRSLDDLLTTICPHFENYPLRTTKYQDFVTFFQICELMKRNHHRSSQGLHKIITLAYTMNPSGKRKYSEKELLTFMRVEGIV